MKAQVKKSSRVTHGDKHLKSTLTESAWAATRTKETFFSAKYHRIAARRGKKRALISVGHSILKCVYHIIKDGVQYKELGAQHLLKRNEQKRVAKLTNTLGDLGYKVTLEKILSNDG